MPELSRPNRPSNQSSCPPACGIRTAPARDFYRSHQYRLMRDNSLMKKQQVEPKGGDHAGLVRRLKEVMDAKSWTPRGWSLDANLNQDAIRNILRGRSEYPRISTLEALA